MSKLLEELGWFAEEFNYCFNDECFTELSQFDATGEGLLSTFTGEHFKITEWEWISNDNPMHPNMAGTLIYEFTWVLSLKKDGEKKGTVFMPCKVIGNLRNDMKFTHMFVFMTPENSALFYKALGIPSIERDPNAFTPENWIENNIRHRNREFSPKKRGESLEEGAKEMFAENWKQSCFLTSCASNWIEGEQLWGGMLGLFEASVTDVANWRFTPSPKGDGSGIFLFILFLARGRKEKNTRAQKKGLFGWKRSFILHLLMGNRA